MAIKGLESVEHNFPLGSTFLKVPLISVIFQWNELLHLTPTEMAGIFLGKGKELLTQYFEKQLLYQDAKLTV